jgi:hypothetical protein
MASVLRLIALLALGFGLSACGVTEEQMRERSRLRIVGIELQAAETAARNRSAAEEIAAARAAGEDCTSVRIFNANAPEGVAVDRRGACATTGVTVPNDARLPSAAQPITGGAFDSGFRRPYVGGCRTYYECYGVGNTIPDWGDGRGSRGLAGQRHDGCYNRRGEYVGRWCILSY